MRRQFMMVTGLRRPVVLAEVSGSHIISIDFMIDHFAFADNFLVHWAYFIIFEERWQTAQVDVLIIYILS